MKRASFLIAVMAVMLGVPAAGSAQTSSTNSATAPVTGMKPDRTTAPVGVRQAMQKREAVKRQKRAVGLNGAGDMDRLPLTRCKVDALG